MKSKIVVYSALFGKDEPYSKSHEWDTPDKYVLHTDRTDLEGDAWHEHVHSDPEGNLRRAARNVKLKPQWVEDDDTIYVWCDAKISLTQRMDEMLPLMKDNDLVFFEHPLRDCVYDEANAIIRLNKDDKEAVKTQMARYHQECLRSHFGLPTTGVILFRNTERVRLFFEIWNDEVQKGSVRDQISVPYALKQAKPRWIQVDWDNANGWYAQEFRKIMGRDQKDVKDILTECADRWNADKGTKGTMCHNFTPIYHEHLKDKREEITTVLDVGIWECASMYMWHDYFPNAKIFGMDVLISNFPQLERTRAFQGDASNPVHIQELFDFMKARPQLICEDGSHQMYDQQQTMKLLFPEILADGGIYILEDLHTSFTWDKGFGVKFDKRNSTWNLLKYLNGEEVEGFDPDITMEEVEAIKAKVKRIDIIQNIANKHVHLAVGSISAIIYKKELEDKSIKPVVVGHEVPGGKVFPDKEQGESDEV